MIQDEATTVTTAAATAAATTNDDASAAAAAANCYPTTATTPIHATEDRTTGHSAADHQSAERSVR